MSVSLEDRTIHLVGECRVEDAEPLARLLAADPSRHINIGRAAGLHTAVIQVLIAYRPPVTGNPADAFIKDWILPAMRHVP